MFRLLPILIFLMSISSTSAQSIYDFTMTTLDGQEQSLSAYQGKVVLIVNVASKCGLTPQYADLQQLYIDYADKGLVILGFPANNFLGQEPGTDEEIASFCQKNYGVSFPMFSKISVKGKERHALYAYLDEQTGEKPGWNFHKYLIDRDGTQVQSISARTKVSEPEVMAEIQRLLGTE